MPNQSVRQRARRTALDAQSRMREARKEQDRRRSGLGVSVVTALAERDALVAVYELRAGEALLSLTDEEGLSLPEAVEWCGDQVNVREATRLRKLAVDASAARTGTGSADPAPQVHQPPVPRFGGHAPKAS
ncbi:MAG: hypothetical protein U0Q14_13525 [Dermatophilaceae bacterium]